MSGPVVIPPGGGEVIGDSADRRVEILCEHDGLHATWSRFGPHRDGADLHVHRRHTDLFYVLEGELTVRLGDGEVVVGAGTLARVPPLVVHGFRNGGDAEAHYLNFHAPGQGFAGYMRSLRDGDPITYDQEPPPADGGRPSAEAVVGGAVESGAGVLVHADIEALRVAEVSQGEPRRLDAPTCLYVLEGELAVGEDVAPPGSWVDVPSGESIHGAARHLEIRVS